MLLIFPFYVCVGICAWVKLLSIPEEAIEFPAMGVTGGWEPPYMSAGK